MTSKKLRQEFLNFFKKNGHKIVPSSSLIPSDPSVLFTTAGMQQFKPYYLGNKSPFGPNVATSQKSFRTSDIEEVGDYNHLTFFEMLGNFSFGGYLREEAIKLAFEFINSKLAGRDCKLDKNKIWITYFKGENNIPEDKESREVWLKMGIPEDRFAGFGRKDNFWGPTGKEGPCGRTTEIHYDLTGKPCDKGKDCVPNCDCRRFIELWNLVFNEYYQDEKGELASLKQKGVDTGMGLERILMVCQGKNSVYETDLFQPLIEEISKISGDLYSSNFSSFRIVSDHVKSSVFLIFDGILPSNIERGYVLRRLLRRAIRHGKLLNLPKDFLIPLAQKAMEIYKDAYPELKNREAEILAAIRNEEEKFEKTLGEGLKKLKKINSQLLTTGVLDLNKTAEGLGKELFNLYQTDGIPLEMSFEEIDWNVFAKIKMPVFDFKKITEQSFKSELKKHQEISRAGAEKKFGGVGKEANYEAAKLHTATHLLQASLRKILGPHVKQMGSDISSQRLRFDFFHPRKTSPEEINKIEELINKKIKEDLEVKKEEMSYEEAVKSGALAFFKEKYPGKVTVYTVKGFSKEICAGPHANRTGELGRFKILREESAGAGIRRIRAILE